MAKSTLHKAKKSNKFKQIKKHLNYIKPLSNSNENVIVAYKIMNSDEYYEFKQKKVFYGSYYDKKCKCIILHLNHDKVNRYIEKKRKSTFSKITVIKCKFEINDSNNFIKFKKSKTKMYLYDRPLKMDDVFTKDVIKPIYQGKSINDVYDVVYCNNSNYNNSDFNCNCNIDITNNNNNHNANINNCITNDDMDCIDDINYDIDYDNDDDSDYVFEEDDD